MPRFSRVLIIALVAWPVAWGAAHARQPTTRELLTELRDREEAINNTYTIIGRYKEELAQKFGISAALAALLGALPAKEALEYIKHCLEIAEKVHTGAEGKEAFELVRLMIEDEQKAKERERELTSWVVSTHNDAVWQEYKQWWVDLKVRKETQAREDDRGSKSCKSKKTKPTLPSAQVPSDGGPSLASRIPDTCDAFEVESRNLPAGSRGQQEAICSLNACIARNGAYPTPQDNYAQVCGGGHNLPDPWTSSSPVVAMPPSVPPAVQPFVNAFCRALGQC